MKTIAKYWCFFWFIACTAQQNDLDKRAIEYCNQNSTSYIAIIWPPALVDGHWIQLKKILNQHVSIVCEKVFLLKNEGPKNFTRYVYRGMPWLSDAKEKALMKERFSQKYYQVPCVAILFTCESFNKAKSCKEYIRVVCRDNIIHMTDTHAETKKLARIVFDDEQINMLNYASQINSVIQ